MRRPLPSAATIDAARREVPGARDALLDAVLPLVLDWCARLGGPRVDAEDACHDVCLVLLAKLHTVSDADRFASWLFGTTRRVLAQHRRRAWLRRWAPGVVVEAVDHGANPARDAERSDTSRRVQATLEGLGDSDREVLVLFDLEERTESEVAELLDIPIGTARSRLRAARQRFRTRSRAHGLAPDVAEFRREGDA
jgi:RNA polymerase sigma-70 factor (ECF subfamily)